MTEINSVIAQRTELKDYLCQHKIDLEQKVDQFLNWANCFTICRLERTPEGVQKEPHELTLFLNSIRPAFVGPAYSLNKYIDAYVEDVFWDDIKYEVDQEKRMSSSLRAISITIEMQNCLLLIKSGLDRLVRLFSFYDRGIASTSTFGRIKENGSAKGFMSQVVSKKDTNPMYSFIYNEYMQWIQECVRPRDAIVHYSDFATSYGYDSDTITEHPVGFSAREDVLAVSFPSLVEYVNRYYNFYNQIFSMLAAQERKICDLENKCSHCWIDAAFKQQAPSLEKSG